MATEEGTAGEPTRLNARQTEQFHAKIAGIVETGKAATMQLCWAAYESDVNMTRVNGQLVFCWATWGHDSWEDFVGKEMDLHVTTALAYKRVWEVFYVNLEGAWSPDLLLGITKMRLLSMAKLTKGNVTSWLKRAKKITCRELAALVQDREELHSFAVPLTASQMRLVRRTLDQAKDSFARGDRMSRGQVMTQIMREWAELKANVRPARSLKVVA